MPYDNEYNKKLAREIDYANRKYIAHCSSTGQGTPDYRANVPGISGSGSGGEATFSDGYSAGADGCGTGGQGILGFQLGSLLGGPKVKEISHRALSSFSSLGAPLSQVMDKSTPVAKALASGTSAVGLPPKPSDATAAAAPTPETPAAAPPDVGAGGDGRPGIKPYRAVPGSFKNSRFSSLVSGPVPASGKYYVAGKYVSVRDLGDFSGTGAGGNMHSCCESCNDGMSCECSGSEEEPEVVVKVGKGGNLERTSMSAAGMPGCGTCGTGMHQKKKQ